jgi:hypothetical protein
VTGTQCVAGACQVIGCSAGWNDFNGDQCAGGCDCANSTAEQQCTQAGSLGATLTVGQTLTPVGSTMAPAPGQQGAPTEGWFTVKFDDNEAPDTAFHPKIVLSSPNSEFIMDIYSTCTGTFLSCGNEGGSSQGVTTWEVYYGPPTGLQPDTFPHTQNGTTTPSHFEQIPTIGDGGQVWIRVYRKPGVPPSCNEYELTASE